jgi:hypothetical protein
MVAGGEALTADARRPKTIMALPKLCLIQSAVNNRATSHDEILYARREDFCPISFL